MDEFLDRAKPQSLEEARQIIRKINDGVSNNEFVYWVITLKNDNKVIGIICLWNISKENFRAEVGYELQPDFQGKGIMQEALSKVIEFGFEIMNLRIIEACTIVNNRNSTKLLVKNNFKKNLQSERKIDRKETLMDMVIYSLANPNK